MNFNDNFENENNFGEPRRCCPRVVFAILPTGPSGSTGGVGPTGPTAK